MSEEKSKAPAPIEAVRNELMRMSDQFKMVLPPNVSVDRFVRVAITAIQMTPDLLNTSRQSLFAELMKCAKDGLIPDGREAAITVYKTQSGPVSQYMPMVGGILKKVRNSGELLNMHPEIVWSKDKFRYWIDDNGPHIEHEPFMDGDRGEPVKVYVVTNTKSEGRYIDVLTKAEVMDVKNVSKAKNGPWSGDFEGEMWKKTAIRRQSKRLPMSTDLDDVIRRDDDLTVLPGSTPAAAPALKAESVSQLPAAPPKEESKSEPEAKPATKIVRNHATGQDVEVPTGKAAHNGNGSNVQSGSQPAGGLPDRATLGKQLQAAFQKLGFKPIDAAEYVQKKAGKKTQDLLDVEMQMLYDELVELAIEKGITL
jgi:recombination protein RecT